MIWFKTLGKDGKSYGEFQWNLEIGEVTIAPDWDGGKLECGKGLHGWPLDKIDECDLLLTKWGEVAIEFEPTNPTEMFDGKAKCESAKILWVGTVLELFKRHPKIKKRLDWCAERGPGAALEYVAPFLTKKRLDWCAEKNPWAALEYAALLLTKERLDWCAKKDPGIALHYAAQWLSKERLTWCTEKEPGIALHYAAPLLSKERLDWCAEKEPRVALKYAVPLLTMGRLEWCKKQIR